MFQNLPKKTYAGWTYVKMRWTKALYVIQGADCTSSNYTIWWTITTSTLGCGSIAHELLPQELPARVLQPCSKWQVTFTGGIKHLCLRTRGCVSACLREQLVRWKVVWPRISPFLWASALKKGQGSTLVAAEVLEIASSSKSWTGPELIMASRAMQQLQSDSM